MKPFVFWGCVYLSFPLASLLGVDADKEGKKEEVQTSPFTPFSFNQDEHGLGNILLLDNYQQTWERGRSWNDEIPYELLGPEIFQNLTYEGEIPLEMPASTFLGQETSHNPPPLVAGFWSATDVNQLPLDTPIITHTFLKKKGDLGRFLERRMPEDKKKLCSWKEYLISCFKAKFLQGIPGNSEETSDDKTLKEKFFEVLDICFRVKIFDDPEVEKSVYNSLYKVIYPSQILPAGPLETIAVRQWWQDKCWSLKNVLTRGQIAQMMWSDECPYQNLYRALSEKVLMKHARNIQWMLSHSREKPKKNPHSQKSSSFEGQSTQLSSQTPSMTILYDELTEKADVLFGRIPLNEQQKFSSWVGYFISFYKNIKNDSPFLQLQGNSEKTLKKKILNAFETAFNVRIFPQMDEDKFYNCLYKKLYRRNLLEPTPGFRRTKESMKWWEDAIKNSNEVLTMRTVKELIQRSDCPDHDDYHKLNEKSQKQMVNTTYKFVHRKDPKACLKRLPLGFGNDEISKLTKRKKNK